MALSVLLGLLYTAVLLCEANTVSFDTSQYYQPVDAATFDVFTAHWSLQHASWIGIMDSIADVCADGYYFPVCVDDRMLGIGDNKCARVVCLEKDPTSCDSTLPPDTIDYIPPAPTTSLDKAVICEVPYSNPNLTGPAYGLDQGLPPYRTPLVRIPLKIYGRISASYGNTCKFLKGAIIEAWQVDVGQLPLVDESTKETSLKDISCRGSIETNEDGSFVFTTTLPPSYGPPRHINLNITADGFQSITSRLYFAEDWRLQSLAPLDGESTEFRRVRHINSKLAATTRGFASDDDASQEEGSSISDHRASTDLNPIVEDIPLPGILANDPRVTSLFLVAENSYNGGSILQGYYETNFTISLKPLRPLEQPNESPIDPSVAPATPASDMTGIWSTREGGLVKIETNGHTFIAIEWPHVRSWGTVAGVLNGDTVRGVDFRLSSPRSEEDIAGVENIDVPPWTTLQDESKEDARARHLKLMALWNGVPDSLWTSDTSTGVLLHDDEFSSAPGSSKIRWSGGGMEEDWARKTEVTGYRFLKLEITRETGGFEGGSLVINEISFFEGILGQREVPTHDKKMKNPRFPAPQLVTCSSFIDQGVHCFRAFDGVATSNSTWVTKPVGSRDHVLTIPQWVLLDLGKGIHVMPTGLRIVCDAAHPSNPQGCPMTFSLYGSHDNVRFKEIFSQDYYDYDNEYSHGGITSHFFWDSPLGRTNGHRCGSCDVSPKFACAYDSYDVSCVSRYCSGSGKCRALPVCPVGQYLDTSVVGLPDDPVSICKPCPAGRYGATEGLRSPSCTDLCSEGYYCTGGSSTPTQHECGHVGVFCPSGTSSPLAAAAGRRTASPTDVIQQYNYSAASGAGTASHRFQSQSSLSKMAQEVLCEKGHYCVGGKQYLCPEGVYGNATGLATAGCTAICVSGDYCPAGSIVPLKCPKGYYCPDGTIKEPCPAGAFGATRGLKDRSCSGLSKSGYYSVPGSSAPTLCPPGKYGESRGLRDENCSGECDYGYYCPGPPIDSNNSDNIGRISEFVPNTNPRQYECGSPDRYCPKGASVPILVSSGYYSAGGTENTASFEMQCEKGFFCVKGVKYSCPAGTFGARAGIFYEDMDQNENICDGFCSAGHYCPLNSTSSTEILCPAGRFGNPAAHSGLGNSDCSGKCPMGHYCPAGTVIPIPCPAGKYGNSTGLTTESCAASCDLIDGPCDTEISLCEPGYFCPEGSLSATQRDCGSASVYCPKGSAEPLPVSPGYYSVGPIISAAQRRISLTVVGVDFGDFDSEPHSLLTVEDEFEGYRHRTSQKICEIGYFCENGVKSKCPAGTFGSTSGLSSNDCSGLCPLGHYCPAGTSKGQYADNVASEGTGWMCPAGRYGGVRGLHTATCSGLCDPGYVCPPGSSSATELQCGSASGLLYFEEFQRAQLGILSRDKNSVKNEIDKMTDRAYDMMCDDFIGATSGDTIMQCSRSQKEISHMIANNVYCPIGSSIPIKVLPGYYAVGGNASTRSWQLPCPYGAYCENGIIRDCPAGRYGKEEKLTTADCSGPCNVGFYCPAGSTSEIEFPCPIGRYGATSGLENAFCTDACHHILDCLSGSTLDGYVPTESQPSVW